jgi:hypothetical protein
MKRYSHKHVYVYRFELTGRDSTRVDHEYTLCTNVDNPNCKENRTLLESMLRLVYGHMPKGVKFLYEKVS